MFECARGPKEKKSLSVVGYRLACWLNIAVFASKVSFFLKHKHHVWRRGSSIEPADSTPKGSEGISDVISKEISEAFSRENFVAQARDRRNSWENSRGWPLEWKFPMTNKKEPFCCTSAVQRLTRYSTRFKTLVKTKITKRPSRN